MSFGEKLVELRNKAGLTQQALAQAANVSISAVRAYEQGTQEPSLKIAFKLAEALAVDVSAFKVTGAAEAPPAKGKAPAEKKAMTKPRRK